MYRTAPNELDYPAWVLLPYIPVYASYEPIPDMGGGENPYDVRVSLADTDWATYQLGLVVTPHPE